MPASLTMSSREIAELTGKRHDNVMVDIRTMLQALGTPVLTSQGSYTGRNRKRLLCFWLPKRECIVLVSGYDIVMRARIVDRWLELDCVIAEADAASAPNTPLSPAEENARLRRIREIRLTYGIRAAQRAWITSGLPIVEGMLVPEQTEMPLAPPPEARH